MKITKYGQSAILIEDYKKKRILIDPGSFCFEQITPEEFGKIDILLITHKHSDHFIPDKIKIIIQNNPGIIVLSNQEVKEILDEAELIFPSETKTIDDIKIKCISQVHGDLPNGMKKPIDIGFLIDNKLYHPGDSIYMEEKPHAEILFLPFCGKVVMDIPDAIKFAREVDAKLIIPIHYDNPAYPADPNNLVSQGKGLNIKILKNKESLVTE